MTQPGDVDWTCETTGCVRDELRRELVELRDYCDQRTVDQGHLATKLATVTSERDYLRERCRELAEEWLGSRYFAGPSDFDTGAAGAFAIAASDLQRIVAESEDDGNGTATPA